MTTNATHCGKKRHVRWPKRLSVCNHVHHPQCGNASPGGIAGTFRPSACNNLLHSHLVTGRLTQHVQHELYSHFRCTILLFTTTAAMQVSKACTSICMWARAMHKYHTVALSVAPKRAALAQAQSQLDSTLAELSAAQAKLQVRVKPHLCWLLTHTASQPEGKFSSCCRHDVSSFSSCR